MRLPGRDTLVGGLIFLGMFVVVRLANRTTEQIQLGLSRPGRLARRIAAEPGLESSARRFAALHYRFKYGVTAWQAAVAVHDAVSVLEEIACQFSADRSKTLDSAVEHLCRRGAIDNDLAGRMRSLYVQRNQIRGAGHGVGEITTPEARQLLDAVSVAITSLLDGVAPQRRLSVEQWLRSWWSILRWGDVS